MSLEAVLNAKRSWHVERCDVLDGLRMLPDGCVNAVVTSPPYWGLRDYGLPPSVWGDGWTGCLGLEPTPEMFIVHCVEVFAEVRRVLRDDGTLWLNIGDSYSVAKGQSGGVDPKQPARRHFGDMRPNDKRIMGCKPKDLIGVPWLLAFALRADGWYLRSEIIWRKRNPMPESVTDRPTKAHEQVFLLSKAARYFYDPIASREKNTAGSVERFGKNPKMSIDKRKYSGMDGESLSSAATKMPEFFADGRNMRSVWSLSSESFKGAHFATFPTKLVRKCLLAGTSEHGCCRECGAPWKRTTEKVRVATRPGTASKVHRNGQAVDRQTGDAVDCPNKPWAANGIEVGNRDPQRHVTKTKTTGWEPTCKCGISDRVPCIVLDPFSGAGTTGVVARRMLLRYIGLELNSAYADMSRRRIRDDAPLLNTS